MSFSPPLGGTEVGDVQEACLGETYRQSAAGKPALVYVVGPYRGPVKR